MASLFDCVLTVYVCGLPPCKFEKDCLGENEETMLRIFYASDIDTDDIPLEFGKTAPRMKFPISNHTTRTNTHAYINFPMTLNGMLDAKKIIQRAPESFKRKGAIPHAAFHFKSEAFVKSLEEELQIQKLMYNKFKDLSLNTSAETSSLSSSRCSDDTCDTASVVSAASASSSSACAYYSDA